MDHGQLTAGLVGGDSGRQGQDSHAQAEFLSHAVSFAATQPHLPNNLVFNHAGYDVYAVAATKHSIRSEEGLEVVPKYSFAD
jgi:hypothetical protein